MGQMSPDDEFKGAELDDPPEQKKPALQFPLGAVKADRLQCIPESHALQSV